MPDFPRLPCILVCVAGWKLCKWKITFCPDPLRCTVLTEQRAGGEVRCQMAFEEQVALGAYIAVIIKWSSLQVYQMEHVVCCIRAHF